MTTATAERFAITIPSETAAGMEVQERILKRLESLGFADRDLFGMRLALEEGLVNAIKHGNKLDPSKVVRVECETAPERVRVMIQDQGDGFVPETVPDPTAAENLEKPCGRGIMLMRNFMTDIHYEDGGRRLVLLKERDPAE